jgi:hypothetical protein
LPGERVEVAIARFGARLGRNRAVIWTLWAVLLITHGAFSRWVETVEHRAKVAVVGDIVLIAVGLITIDQLQSLDFANLVRVGLFFTAFGWSGRQLMGSFLRRPAA